jgi:ubiquitin-protein ligase
LFFFSLFGRWVIEVTGAPGTLYTNETYQLQVDFPENYPMEAPQVIFFLFFSLIYMNLPFIASFGVH